MVRYQLDHDFDVVDKSTDCIDQKMTEIATTVSDDNDDDIHMEDVDGIQPGDHGEDDDYNSGLEGEDDNGDETGFPNSASRALSTYTGNSLDRPPGTTIQENHYHIYYTPPPEYYDDGPTSSCCGRWICRIVTSWWFVAMVALSFQVVYNYGPPVAPPRQSVSSNDGTAEVVLWKDFWDHQFDVVKTLVKTWGHELPAHVSSWCWQELREDLLAKFHGQHVSTPKNPSYQDYGAHGDSPYHCRWEAQFFQRDASESIDELALHRKRLKQALITSVFGQDLAIDMIDRMIASRRDQYHSTSPILLYLTGGSHVGKTHLARTLSLGFFTPPSKGKCKIDLVGDVGSPILTIHEKDVARVAKGETLIDAILEHTQNSSPIFGGSAVIVTHVEELPPGVFNKILSRLSSLDDHPNLLVVFTSNVASKVIQKSIQMYGGVDSVPSLELQAFVSHHVDTFHDGEGAAQQDLLASSSEEDVATSKSVSTHVDSIVPLFPLGKSELSLILQDQLNTRIRNQLRLGDHHEDESPQTLSLRLTSAAMDALMEHVEFHTWLHKSTQQTIFTYSPTGAKSVSSSGMLVSNLADRLIRDCFRPSFSGSNNEIAENNRFILDTVLQYSAAIDDGSESVRQMQYVLQSCATAGDVNIITTPGSQCSELCHFQL